MYVLGIHPDGDYFKVALLKCSGKKSRIIFLQEYKKDILDLNQLKRKILKETKYKQEDIETISALTPEEVFVKNISFPFTSKSSVMKALPFQMEKLLPFSEEHVITIAQIKRGKKESNVTLYTFFNETLQSHLQDIKTLGFDSDTVSTVSKALSRFKSYFVKERQTVTLLYFGWEKSYLIYVDGEETKHSLVIEVGFRMLIDAAKEDYPDVAEIDFTFLKKEIVKYFKKELCEGQVKDVFLKLWKGLARSFEYIKKKETLSHLDLVHLGYSAISEDMTNNMSEVSTKSIDISPHLEFDRQQLKSYAIEIGLALDSSQADKNKIQFRIGEFAPSKQIAKIKRKIRALLGLSIICSVVTFVLMTLFFVKKEALIRERFNYITTLGYDKPKSYSGIQKAFFSANQFQKEMDLFLEKIRGQKQEGGFLKEPLLVSECLKEITKEIRPKEIQYELLSYPTLEKSKEGYIAKLVIFFDSPTMDEAKKLLEKSPLLKKGEIEYLKEKNGNQMVFVFKQER